MKRQFAFLLILLFSGRTLSAQSLKVEQLKDSTYSITVNTSIYKLFWNAKPDSWKHIRPLKLKSNPDTVVLSSAHPILKLETPKEKSLYQAPRLVKLQGGSNFRDLGGYRTKEGKQVKWGKMYRSADISKLTDKDMNILSSLNIKMVCDLRGEKEVATAPDRIPEGTQRILLSAGSENIGGMNSSFMKVLKKPESADSMMIEFYKRTDHLTKKYKPMFEQLLNLEQDQALLIHCTAGKDRTGIGAALILYALGVDEETIFQDYLLTNEYRKESDEKFVKGMVAQGLSEKAARNLMAAKRDYLQVTFDAIKNAYGSIDNFLTKEIGLDATNKERFKNKFLY